MSREELCERLRSTNIFARVVPDQKLLLVQLLQARNHDLTMNMMHMIVFYCSGTER